MWILKVAEKNEKLNTDEEFHEDNLEKLQALSFDTKIDIISFISTRSKFCITTRRVDNLVLKTNLTRGG